MASKRLDPVLTTLATMAIALATAFAGDWSTYKGDPARTGVAAEALTFPLAKKWVYQPSQPPMPAWPEPGKELHRMDFDYAFQPVVAGGMVYFGSSADDTVRALKAATGERVWRFTANGPIRFAPAVASGRAYVASDDGWLYCLDARTGKEIWRFRGAPSGDQVIGNGRIISRWPCRSGVLVVDDVVYFTAGMWPTEGVYVYALDAETGRELWRNDGSGDIYVDLPHPGASGFDGVAPQGYLLAHDDKLLVATGRCVPAAFDRDTGRLLYYKPAEALYHGGAWMTSAGDLYFNPKNRFQNPSEAFVGEAQPSPGDGMFAYSFASGEREFTLNGKYRVLASGDVIYAVGGGRIQAIDLNALRKRRRVTARDVKWTTPQSSRVYCLAAADEALLLGGPSSITALDCKNGERIWSAEVEGQVRGFAISDGRLVAATNKGTLLCFEQSATSDRPAMRIEEPISPPSIPADRKGAASEIIKRSDKSGGYALVIGGRDARLAEALAAQTTLRIVSVLRGESNVRAERERLLRSGLYGPRVWIEEAGRLPFLPPYFADLVVVSSDVKGAAAKDCYRLLHPCGGVLCFVGLSEAEARAFIKDAGLPESEVGEGGRMITRGPLPGAGDWRYPWADGGRSGVGKESRVRLPLDLLWFGGPGPDRLVDRHLMTSPPLSTNGRVFMTGQRHVIAFDAYNGRELWNRQIPNVGRKYAQYYSSGFVADHDALYVVKKDQCYRLDQATGKTIGVYTVPESVIKETPPPVTQRYVHVEWPEEWQVIGPFPKGKPPLSSKDLSEMPQSVVVGGEEYVAAPLEAVNQTIDFSNLYGGYGLKPLAPGERPGAYRRKGAKRGLAFAGRIAYAFARINCPEAGKLLIGAGADWWMQWYLDGKPVFDTLRGGNQPSRHNYYSPQPCSPKDFLFDVDVAAGQHVLAVMVKSGAGGWALASASMADDPKGAMPVESGLDPNFPNLRDMIWGYVSVTDDLVLGSYTVPITEGQPAESHLIWRSESKALFALNKKDGLLRWVYRPKRDRTVSNIEIAFGDGRLFLLDATSKADSTKARRRGEKPKIELSLVALNLADGAELWRQDDVPALPDRSFPTRIKSNPGHLFMGLPNWGHLVYAKGVVVLGANAAYDAATGRKLWQKKVRPQKLPVVLGDWIIAHPYAYALRTGEQRMTVDILTRRKTPWRYPRAYGCGPVNGCQQLLFFRSGADGLFDVNVGGTSNFGGTRPGCSRSLVAANGLLIHPEGYSGCSCSYNYQTSLALVPGPDWRNNWYVFPRGVGAGMIKHIAINFGAPGDQRDGRGTAWLGFPRPMMANACPVPATILMEDPACFYRRKAAGSIKGADSPWVYASGLRGRGKIAIGLVLDPSLLIPTRNAAPTIDGKLDEPCWKGARAAAFENTPFSMLSASVDLRLFKDAEGLHFGYHRKRVANPLKDADETMIGRSEAFEIYITDRKKKGGVHCGVKRNGKAFITFGTVDRYRKVDRNWSGEWLHAVARGRNEWTAEISIPLKTLAESGIDVGRLQLNCMSKNLTAAGLESIFLVDPVYGGDFKRCIRFLRVVAPSGRRPKRRSFTVRLHFAELDDVKAGQRVFDVAIQGKTVLSDLDILKEAGGKNTALVKEVGGVECDDQMVIELTPNVEPGNAEATPVINGIEIIEEG